MSLTDIRLEIDFFLENEEKSEDYFWALPAKIVNLMQGN
jgi:hypothetical protein